MGASHLERVLDTGQNVRRLRDTWVELSSDWKALVVASVVIGLSQAGLSIPL